MSHHSSAGVYTMLTPCSLLSASTVDVLSSQRTKNWWVVQDPSGSHIWCQSQYPTTSSIPRLSSYSMHWPSNAFKCINPLTARLHWIWALTYSTLWLLTTQMKEPTLLMYFFDHWRQPGEQCKSKPQAILKAQQHHKAEMFLWFIVGYTLWWFMAFQFSCNWIFPIIVVCEWTLSSGEMTLPPISPFVCFLTFPQFEFTFSVKLHSSFTKVAQKKVFQ